MSGVVYLGIALTAATAVWMGYTFKRKPGWRAWCDNSWRWRRRRRRLVGTGKFRRPATINKGLEIMKIIPSKIVDGHIMNTDKFGRIACGWSLCLLIMFAGMSHGDVKLSTELFSDHMVLQQNQKILVWGWASPGEQVTVSFCGQTMTATANEQGLWNIILASLKAGGPFEMTVTGKNTVTIKDVLVGEVWIYAGQSNMAWPVEEARNAQAEIATATNSLIRIFQSNGGAVDAPAEIAGGRWFAIGPATVAGQSATAYFFARELQKTIKVPVGMIGRGIGSSYADAWTPRSVMMKDPDLKPIVDRTDARILEWAKEIHHVADIAESWLPEAEKAQAAGKSLPPLPVLKVENGIMWNSWMASGMFNGMIAPMAPYGIRGAIWYQGEANTVRGWQYRKLLPAMIAGWRQWWAHTPGRNFGVPAGDFTFLFVQLPNCGPAKNEPGDSDWAELRESQMKASQTIPKAGMAVTIDIGEAESIHPRNKQDVGTRLSLLARSIAYGDKIVASGPLYDRFKIDENTMRIDFKKPGGNLAAKGGEPLKGFAIAGADKKFVWADAKIVDNTLVVSSGKITNPVAVRYAWAQNPQGCNLFNSEGLPASPFRTDEWPGLNDDQR